MFIPEEFAHSEVQHMKKITYTDRETHTHDGMVATISHVRCHNSATTGQRIDERFDVELKVTDNICLYESLNTLYWARRWIQDQFNDTKSILILRHSK